MMSEIRYENWKPSGSSIAVVTQARAICREYAESGYDLTLRQLYYQFVARALIPNSQRSYKNLGSVINKARMAGYLDWDYIVDRTRNLEEMTHWRSAADILGGAAAGFQLDRWEDQEYRVEVWIEKDALTGVIEGICNELDVPYFSCRGYTSQSEMWRAAMRLRGYEAEGKSTVVIHLGDHDPSGIDMTRDIQDRLWTFHAHTEVERIALNWDQIEQYQPPPNPTKLTDSRSAGYVSEFGYESWELDALEPSVMVAMVRDQVLVYRDEDVHEVMIERENDIITGLHELAAAPWRETLEWLRS
jgi:hypothetical protein